MQFSPKEEPGGGSWTYEEGEGVQLNGRDGEDTGELPPTPTGGRRGLETETTSQSSYSNWSIGSLPEPRPVNTDGQTSVSSFLPEAGFRSIYPTSNGSTRLRTLYRATSNVCPGKSTARPVSSMSHIKAGPRHFGALFQPKSSQKVTGFPYCTSAQPKDLFCTNRQPNLLLAISFEATTRATMRSFRC